MRLLMLLLLSILCLAVQAAPFAAEVTLREVLGHAWAEDLVHRRVTIPGQGLLFANKAALFQGERAVPMQFDNQVFYPDGSIKEADVWFRSDLPAKGTRTFALRAVAKVPKEAGRTDLTVKTV